MPDLRADMTNKWNGSAVKNVVITDRNFNVKVAPNAKSGVEMCRLARKLVPGGFLWADANGGLRSGHRAGRAAVQIYAAYDLKFPAALNGPRFLAGTYLKKLLVVKDGEIEVPTGAGLGVEIDEARIKS